MKYFGVIALVVILVLALVLGLLLGDRAKDDPRRLAQAERIEQETARKTEEAEFFLPFRLALYAALGSVTVVGVGLGLWGGFLLLKRQSEATYASRNGIAPTIRTQKGGREVILDPATLIGPMVIEPDGTPRYILPDAAVQRLLGVAIPGAAAARVVAALPQQTAQAIDTPGAAIQASQAALSAYREYPPVRHIQGPDAEAHILRLLDEGTLETQE